jgi:hypothetical protein
MIVSWRRWGLVLALGLLTVSTLLAQFRGAPAPRFGGGGGVGRGYGGFGGVRSFGGGGGSSRSSNPATLIDTAAKNLTPQIEKGSWEQANQTISDYLYTRPPALQALREMLREAKQVARLERLRSALVAPPGEEFVAWQRVAVRKLPDDLRPPARLIAALVALQTEARRTGPPGDMEDLQDALADFRQLSRDPALADRICFDLAGRAFFAGAGAEARQLLSLAGRTSSSADAGALLADIKTILLGEGGTTHTDAAEAALTPRPATGGATVRGPPKGLALLLPSEATSLWRAPTPATPSGPALLDRSVATFLAGQGALARQRLNSASNFSPAQADARLRDLRTHLTGDEDASPDEARPSGGWPYTSMPFAEVRGGDVRAGIEEDALRFLEPIDSVRTASLQLPAHRQQLRRRMKQELSLARQRLQQAHQKAVQALTSGGGPGGDLPLPGVFVIVPDDEEKRRLRERLEQLRGSGLNDRAWRLALQLRRAGESLEDVVAEIGPK